MMGGNTIFGALFVGIGMVRMIVILALVALQIVARRKVFSKAGLPGRGIFVPVYNRVLMLKVGRLSGRWLLSLHVAVVFGVISTANPEQALPALLCVLAILLRGIVMIINYFKIARNF